MRLALSCFSSFPSSSSPFFFLSPFLCISETGEEMTRTSSQAPWDNGPALGTGMGVAPALTQAGSARAHTFTATSVSLFRQPSCVLHERISHLSLPPQTELGVWMTCETSHLCKIPDLTFSLQPKPKTEKRKETKAISGLPSPDFSKCLWRLRGPI